MERTDWPTVGVLRLGNVRKKTWTGGRFENPQRDGSVGETPLPREDRADRSVAEDGTATQRQQAIRDDLVTACLGGQR